MISKIKLEKFDTIPFEEGTSEMKNISEDRLNKMKRFSSNFEEMFSFWYQKDLNPKFNLNIYDEEMKSNAEFGLKFVTIQSHPNSIRVHANNELCIVGYGCNESKEYSTIIFDVTGNIIVEAQRGVQLPKILIIQKLSNLTFKTPFNSDRMCLIELYSMY